MARSPQQQPRPLPKAKFYVIAPGTQSPLGPVPIVDEPDGTRTVTMTAVEAQFWLDQNVISGAHPAEVDKRRQDRRADAEAATAKAADTPPQGQRLAVQSPTDDDPADRMARGEKEIMGRSIGKRSQLKG